MKEWFSASELVGMPGLPNTPQNVKCRAKRECWKKQKRKGRGGGWEYHLSSLPKETEQHLRHQYYLSHIHETINANPLFADMITPEVIPGVKTREQLASDEAERRKVKERSMAEFARIPKDDRRKKRARARIWMLESFWNYKRDHKCTKKVALDSIIEDFHSGKMAPPEWVLEMMPKYNGKRGLKSGTLTKWDRDYHNKGIMALTDDYGNRDHQTIIETTVVLFRLVLGAMAKAPQISGRSMVDFIKATNAKRQEQGEEQLPVPSIRTYQRFSKKWIEENHQVWTRLINPDMWKNFYMAAAGSHFENITELNMLWELDSTPADWMLKDGRHSVVGVIDMWSRRLKFYVSKTSKAMAVCQLTRWAIMAWGVPQGVRTDNGKDYVSDQYDLVLRELSIMHEICIPFASEEKGTIERSMRTMSHGILNLLPGFIGHNVAERKQIEARKSFAQRIMTQGEVIEVEMSAEDLQKHLDDWCESVYGRNEHSGIGMSPFDKARSYTGPIRRIEDERALDMLLCELGGSRKITKKGIRFENHTYFNDDLGEHIGKDVLLKYDERDIGRLYAYVEEQFIGVVICHELLGISRQEAAVAVKSKQKKKVAEQVSELKSYTKEIKGNLAETVLEYRIEESENIVAMPHRSEPHITPGLEQAGKAVRENDPIQPAQLTKEQQSVFDRIHAEDKSDKQCDIIRFGGDPGDNYGLHQQLKARLERGETLSAEQMMEIERYEAGDDYKAIAKYA